MFDRRFPINTFKDNIFIKITSCTNIVKGTHSMKH